MNLEDYLARLQQMAERERKRQEGRDRGKGRPDGRRSAGFSFYRDV